MSARPPVVIHDPGGPNWLVEWTDAVTHTGGESVSFTVAVPRNGELSIAEIQRFALKRAVELLQLMIANAPTPRQ